WAGKDGGHQRKTKLGIEETEVRAVLRVDVVTAQRHYRRREDEVCDVIDRKSFIAEMTIDPVLDTARVKELLARAHGRSTRQPESQRVHTAGEGRIRTRVCQHGGKPHGLSSNQTRRSGSSERNATPCDWVAEAGRRDVLRERKRRMKWRPGYRLARGIAEVRLAHAQHEKVELQAAELIERLAGRQARAVLPLAEVREARVTRQQPRDVVSRHARVDP